jgi:hypothetical protein
MVSATIPHAPAMSWAASDSLLAVERNMLAVRDELTAAVARLSHLVLDPTLTKKQAAECGRALVGLQAMLSHLGAVEAMTRHTTGEAGETSLWGEECYEG